MRQSVRILITAFLLVCQTAQAFIRNPLEELVDPTCTPSEKAPVQKYATFVNGSRRYNWEIRLLTKGNHFNYEICMDLLAKRDIRDGVVQDFKFEKGEE